MSKKLNSMIIPDMVIKMMKDNIDITRYKKIESGFNLCKLNKHIRAESQCTGTSCMLIHKAKCQNGEFVGTFHTHYDQPIIEPSLTDLVSAYKYGLSCIGSHSIIYNADCYKRKGDMNEEILRQLKDQSIIEMLPSLRSLIPTKDIVLQKTELENNRRKAKNLFDVITILRDL